MLNAFAVAALLALPPGHSGMSVDPASRVIKPLRLAATCLKTGEETSGMNKICYYNCTGSSAAITIGAAQLCPLTIDR